PPECKITQQGGEYIGRKNVSYSGFACKPWGEEWRTTILGNGTFFIPAFPDYKETEETHNFCRNPDGDGAPWCSIENDMNFEYCDIPFCEIQEVQVGPEGNVYPECRLTEKGKEYVGTKDVTETGKPCLDWSSQPYGMPWDFFNQKMHFSEHFLNLNPSIHKNYCRNPALYREKPWCFVSDADIEWEYCDIPFCHNLSASLNSILPPECKLTEIGGEYVGRWNTTISGFQCKHWMANFPRSGNAISQLLSAFPDEVDGSHNFCRNPDGMGHGPWCYLREKGKGFDWEYCDVTSCPQTGERCDIRVSGNCISGSSFFIVLNVFGLHTIIYSTFVEHQSISPKECKDDRKGLNYVGKKNITKSGYRCQQWMTRIPNALREDFYWKAKSFPDDLHPSHNFCRNPDGSWKGPWCYNGDGTDPERDDCDIEYCG
ncbi:unnamed protein product, partial [Darwinula stevensoni]